MTVVKIQTQDAVNSSSSMLDALTNDYVWDDFIQRKKIKTPEDYRLERYEELSKNVECRALASRIADGNYQFSIPLKKLISKFRIGKKRTVYSFNEYEMMSLRIISSLLYEYDYLFSSNLYSFRRNTGVRNAIDELRFNPHLKKMFGYKADVHNYFNSINTDYLLASLKEDIDDERLFVLFKKILSDKRANFNGNVVEEEKGVMAGIPISAFLANYYLREVDEFFLRENCIYMRYADDIILFCESEIELNRLRDELLMRIQNKGLEMNPKKESYYSPGDRFDFLGFSICGDEIDLSEATVRKMKGKIRRSSKSIRRWMISKNAPLNGTIRALIRTYNDKFFGFEESELTWARWFFPVITTSKSLHEIDEYFQEWIRYVPSGRHTKKNYDLVPYSLMKECGYRSLVNEYYRSLSHDGGEIKPVETL